MKRIVLLWFLLSCLLNASVAQSCQTLSRQQALRFLMNAFFFMHNVDCSSLKVKYLHQLTAADYYNHCIMHFSFKDQPSTHLCILIPQSPLSSFHKQIHLLISFDKKAQIANITLSNEHQLPCVKEILAMMSR